jgi:hypothetical protein
LTRLLVDDDKGSTFAAFFIRFCGAFDALLLRSCCAFGASLAAPCYALRRPCGVLATLLTAPLRRLCYAFAAPFDALLLTTGIRLSSTHPHALHLIPVNVIALN